MDLATTIFESADPLGDPFLLEDGSVPGGSDPATDIVAITQAKFSIDRPGAQALMRWLKDIGEEARVISGMPIRRIVRPGPWEWYPSPPRAIPTTAPEAPRVYQVGFQGPAGRSVAAVLPETNPLDGARDIVHYRQDPSEDGEVRHSALQTDAGSRRTGADGSIYYNAPAHVVIVTPDGIQFFVPGSGPGGWCPAEGLGWRGLGLRLGPRWPDRVHPHRRAGSRAVAVAQPSSSGTTEVPDQTFTLAGQAQ